MIFMLTIIRWIVWAERMVRTAPGLPLRAVLAAGLSIAYLVGLLGLVVAGLAYAVPELIVSVWSRARRASPEAVEDLRAFETMAGSLRVLMDARAAATTPNERAGADAQLGGYLIEQTTALMRPFLEQVVRRAVEEDVTSQVDRGER